MNNTFAKLVIRSTALASLCLTALFYLLTSQLAIPVEAFPAQTILIAPIEAASGVNSLNAQATYQQSQSTPGGPANPGEIECQLIGNYPEKIYQWCELITRYAVRVNLEPELVAALIWTESSGNAQAYSHSGAVGLMQVMPRDGLAASFQCPNGPCFADRPTIEELKNPEFNLSYGTKMLATLINKYGDVREALHAYGPSSVGYSYADQVLEIYHTYKNNP